MKTEVKVLQLLLKLPVTFPVLIPATSIVLLSVQIPPPFSSSVVTETAATSDGQRAVL